MRALTKWSIAFALALAGCSATVGGGGGVGDPSAGTLPSTPAGGSTPSTTANGPRSVSRLTADEYTSAVSNLLGVAPVQGPGSAPGDTLATEDAMALAYHSAALDVARTATSPTNLPALLTRVSAGCTVPAGDDAAAGASCAMAFIQQLAPRAFRSAAPDPASTSGLIDVYAAAASTQAFSGSIAAVLEEVLQSPYFLYHLPGQAQ